MEEAKAEQYEQMLGDTTGDLIIEGFTLSFPKERKLVERAVGEHRAIILRLNIGYGRWVNFRKLKLGRNNEQPDIKHFRRKSSYFEGMEHETIYEFKHPQDMLVHYSKYQNDEFMNAKIEALKLPIKNGDVVNDVGCNEGRIGRWCLDNNASRVIGYEKNWRFLDHAKLAGLEPRLGNIETDLMELADVTICISVFHYFRDPQSFIEKARRSTRRVFVLELPIYIQPTDAPSPNYTSKWFPDHGPATHYSQDIIEFWLNKNFSKVDFIQHSPPPSDFKGRRRKNPNRQTRSVYHCYV